MTQEALMRWSQIEMSWSQLKDKLAIWPFRSSEDDGDEREGPNDAQSSQVGESEDPQPEAFLPDDRGRRSEFSLHIGC